MLFFADIKEEKKMKRLVRDRLRYPDEVYCAGGRVVELLHNIVRDLYNESHETMEIEDEKGHIAPGFVGGGSQYVAFHVRRGDFQHKFTQWPAQRILDSTEPLIPNRHERVLYISTDEMNQTYVGFFLYVER
jgi:hypothetical protein